MNIISQISGCLKLTAAPVIPDGVTHVELTRSVAPVSIADSVIDLNMVDSTFPLKTLPPNVQVVKLNVASHKLLTQPGCLPQSIANLEANANDGIVQNVLPLALKKLTLWKLEHPLIFSLPHGLTHLVLGPKYRHRFTNNVLPSTLTHLRCSHQLLAALEPGVIPNGLVDIIIRSSDLASDNDETPSIKTGIIPDSVVSLCIEAWLAKFDSLPSHLTHLKIKKCKDALIVPDSVTHLFLCTDMPHHLPNSLTHLYISDTVTINQVIPSTVTHLRLPSCQILPGLIPSSVTHLVFNCLSSQKLVKGLIPDSVIYLTFGDRFNRPLDAGVIPASATHIAFGELFNHAIKARAIPSSTTHLYLGELFNTPIQRYVIPKSITHLVFGDSFNQPMYPGIIPNAVTYLGFGKKFDQVVTPDCIPSSVTHLELRDISGTTRPTYLSKADVKWLPPSITHLSYDSDDLARPGYKDTHWVYGIISQS